MKKLNSTLCYILSILFFVANTVNASNATYYGDSDIQVTDSTTQLIIVEKKITTDSISTTKQDSINIELNKSPRKFSIKK